MSKGEVHSRTALDRIFEPRSIAIVGASADPTKRGYQILRALVDSGFRGAIYPVNPRGGKILDRPVYLSLHQLPAPPDLAVLCTPAATAPDLVRACGKVGAAGAIVLAVGFGESGPRGEFLEAQLAKAGAESGVRIIGPNTSGMLRLDSGINLVGARGVRAGGLALVAQSGNVALALMNEVTERSWEGISFYIGVGNELDLGFADALDFLEHDEKTRAIIVYAEGIRAPRRFLASAARVTRTKPIVAIKSARTSEGALAAASHTGSMAGPYERLHAGMSQAGIVELTRTDELLHVAEALANQPPIPPGLGIAILSDGGGQGTLAADTLVEAGGSLTLLSEQTQARLRDILGGAAAVANPVDLAGAADADPKMFARALKIVAEDPECGAVLVIGLFGGYGVRFADHLTAGEVEAAEAMQATMRGNGTALVVHSMYASHRTAPLTILGEAGVPVVGSLETACRAVVELQRRGQMLADPPWEIGVNWERGPEPDGCEPRTLTEPEARTLLTAWGLGFGEGTVVRCASEAGRFVDEYPGAYALKLISNVISHKSDAGGVILDVKTAAEARAAFDKILANAEAYTRQHGLSLSETTALVTPMLPRPRLELLIGAVVDPKLGPILTVGAGGIWVEALRDAAHRVLPVRNPEIETMLKELHVSRMLAGGRGLPPVATGPIVHAVQAVARCITENTSVTEIEVNPLFVYDGYCAPVDARVVVTGAPPQPP